MEKKKDKIELLKTLDKKIKTSDDLELKSAMIAKKKILSKNLPVKK